MQMRLLGATVLAGMLIADPTLIAKEKAKGAWKDATVSVGDIKIHYIEAGSGERNLVFMPGWTMPAEVWREQIPYFSARGFRVIAFDPRSQGQTTKTDGGNTYQQQAADLHAFLKALSLKDAILVGWSEGVAVLLEYASSSEAVLPEKVVLVDGSPMGYKEGDYPGGMTIQQARSVLLSFQEDRAKATDKFVRGMFSGRQQELLYKELTDASLKTPTGTALSLFFDLYTGDRRAGLYKITVPTLIIVRPENRLVGEYMQSKISRSKLEVIPEAGHAMFLERPQAFNQVLESFLGEN
ncbi:MAG TPA: alpha/beta hydrolase [Acidobacteriota bacterium]|nr:alpha/beta hydrolase [Acidobacteriota bacterium]